MRTGAERADGGRRWIAGRFLGAARSRKPCQISVAEMINPPTPAKIRGRLLDDDVEEELGSGSLTGGTLAVLFTADVSTVSTSPGKV